ncbi:MAG: thiamine pyrophosphate-dependent enzyme [Bacteroidetes bacterium]|nr:thiamine pyrophosphate-dependent enzyme [Bacteroidota bacterium]
MLQVETTIDTALLLKAYRLMCAEKAMADTYEKNRDITKYVHSTSRGHEAIQIAMGLQLRPYDYASLYYRDAMMLQAMGITPYELMLQLLAKKDDPFSGGRSYYAHPSLRRDGFPTIPHQSSATGMQAIPATGMAHGIKYLEGRKKINTAEPPVVLCSMGDGSVTEGEVAEAFQEAVLHELPIFYLIQDNGWGISVTADEMRTMDAYEYAAGFKGMERRRVDGSDFLKSFAAIEECIGYVRENRKPILLHATCPLLGHHTSGVRKEFYRTEDDLNQHYKDDPGPKLRRVLLDSGVAEDEIISLETTIVNEIEEAFKKAVASAEPEPESVYLHEFAPTKITEEKGVRSPEGGRTIIMVDAALYAIREIMEDHEECILYGQDVGKRLGGVFREAATLGEQYGDDRVFNTPIQEAYIIGSTAGMSAVGVKPIVEVQFCDYIWPGINQLVTELSKSCYLTMGKFPVSSIVRVPVGGYGGGGPYHSGTHESAILTIKGIKVAYPSNAADMKGLMKAAYHDPNPVVMLEHKGLYWSKVPGTDAAKTIEPDSDYIIPFGKGRIALEATEEKIKAGNSAVVITYGMGVHWALNAAKELGGSIEIVDLRSLYPMDEELVMERVKAHGKCLVLTEEQLLNSFAESVAGRISQQCFTWLDAPVMTLGAANLPAVAMNMGLEKEMLPNKDKVVAKLGELLGW